MHSWVTIHAGPIPKIITLQALLESAGIATRMPDAMMKIVDPFVTGSDPLGAELQVPRKQAIEAHTLIARFERDGKAFAAEDAAAGAGAGAGAGTETETAADTDTDTELDVATVLALEEARRLGVKTRWCLLLPGLASIPGLIFARRYARLARSMPVRLSEHAQVITAGCIHVVFVAGVLLVVAGILVNAAGLLMRSAP